MSLEEMERRKVPPQYLEEVLNQAGIFIDWLLRFSGGDECLYGIMVVFCSSVHKSMHSDQSDSRTMVAKEIWGHQRPSTSD